jgi:hypothetical protein
LGPQRIFKTTIDVVLCIAALPFVLAAFWLFAWFSLLPLMFVVAAIWPSAIPDI